MKAIYTLALFFTIISLSQCGTFDFIGNYISVILRADILDIIEEETTEDIEKMAAITPTDKSYMRTGVFETWKKRIPWLLLLMISATFTGKIILILNQLYLHMLF